MSDRDKFRKHAELVDRMAAVQGIDLQEAAIQGKLSIDDISDVVLRCSDCPNPEHCTKLLAELSQLDHVPEYCRNKDLFKDLKS